MHRFCPNGSGPRGDSDRSEGLFPAEFARVTSGSLRASRCVRLRFIYRTRTVCFRAGGPSQRPQACRLRWAGKRNLGNRYVMTPDVPPAGLGPATAPPGDGAALTALLPDFPFKAAHSRRLPPVQAVSFRPPHGRPSGSFAFRRHPSFPPVPSNPKSIQES